MNGYPASASGSGRFSTNRWNPPPAGLYMARRVGFSRITVPRFAISPMSLRNYQLVSAVKICSWSLSIDVAGRRQCALAPTAAADQVPRSPTASRPPIMSALYTFDARDDVATRCVDTWCFTEIRKQESVNILNLNDATMQVTGAGVLLHGLPVLCPASKSSAPRETSSPTREVACQPITPKNFWFWKKICLNFELAATVNNVNLMD